MRGLTVYRQLCLIFVFNVNVVTSVVSGRSIQTCGNVLSSETPTDLVSKDEISNLSLLTAFIS